MVELRSEPYTLKTRSDVIDIEQEFRDNLIEYKDSHVANKRMSAKRVQQVSDISRTRLH